MAVGEIHGGVEVRDRERGEYRSELLFAGEPRGRVDSGDDDRARRSIRLSGTSVRRNERPSRTREPVPAASRSLACASASMTGPSWLPASRVGPMTSDRVASTTRSTTASWTLSTQMSRLAAEHFCPENPNVDETTAGTTSSRSASLSTMIAFLPPSSAMTRTIDRRPSCAAARGLDDAETDIARAGEGDEVDPRVRDERCARVGPVAGEEREHVGGQPGLEKRRDEHRGDRRGLLGGLEERRRSR